MAAKRRITINGSIERCPYLGMAAACPYLVTAARLRPNTHTRRTTPSTPRAQQGEARQRNQRSNGDSDTSTGTGGRTEKDREQQRQQQTMKPRSAGKQVEVAGQVSARLSVADQNRRAWWCRWWYDTKSARRCPQRCNPGMVTEGNQARRGQWIREGQQMRYRVRTAHTRRADGGQRMKRMDIARRIRPRS